MYGLLIAHSDAQARKQMADLFADAGYDVTTTGSAAAAIVRILRKTARVVLLGPECDQLSAAELIPLLKKCDRRLSIIFVAAEASLPLIRKLRREGIFYHALRPVDAEDGEEIRQAVRCAFERMFREEAPPGPVAKKEERP